MDDLRVISATVDHSTNEIEIVVEKSGDGFWHEDDRIFTMVIDAKDVENRGQEWIKAKKS